MSNPLDLFPNDCIETPASKDRDGYGRIKTSKSFAEFTHRLAYRIFNGEIPTGLVVMHACDNPACCNPKHLFLGTQKDNVADSIRKGRRPQNPASHKNTRLSVDDVLRIRTQELHVPTKILAEKYGACENTIRNVKNGFSWPGVCGGGSLNPRIPS